MASITSYTEYQQEYDALTAQMDAELQVVGAENSKCAAAALVTYRACGQAADEAFRAAIEANVDRAVAEFDRARALDACDAVYKQALDACDAVSAPKSKAIRDRYDPLFGDLGKRARDGLARLPRLIISWDELATQAGKLKDVYWSSGTPAPESAPILKVKSYPELQKALEHDRFVNELLLMVRANKKALQLGGEHKTLTKIVTDWGPKVRTHVDDHVYLRGELTGEAPTDLEPFRTMLGAGRISTGWTPKDVFDRIPVAEKLCFPPSAFINFQQASGFGTLAERYIEINYCEQLGCGPPVGTAVVPGPGWTDYRDLNNPTEWRNFLINHDPALADPDSDLLITALDLIGVRPDIMTNKGARKEYYEIKPFSPSGASAGMTKLGTLITLMRRLKQPYIPGVTYTGAKIPMVSGSVRGFAISASLEVSRPLPGLLLYKLCLEGELVEILERMAIVALILLIIAWILSRIAPVLPPIPPIPVPVPI